MHDKGTLNFLLALYFVNGMLRLVDFLLTSNENSTENYTVVLPILVQRPTAKTWLLLLMPVS